VRSEDDFDLEVIGRIPDPKISGEQSRMALMAVEEQPVE